MLFFCNPRLKAGRDVDFSALILVDAPVNWRLPWLLRVVALVVTSSTLSWSQLIVPLSYTASPGGVGSFTYFDESGSQLTDGVFGVDDWTADLGNGNAQEWVGWTSPPPSITFTFSGAPTIHTVLISFNRGEATGAIFLPTTVTISGIEFSLAGDELPDGTRGFLSFSGPWTGYTLQIDMAPRGPFTFVDEIQFSPVAVPEPSTLTLLALGGVVIAQFFQRRKNRKSPYFPRIWAISFAK